MTRPAAVLHGKLFTGLRERIGRGHCGRGLWRHKRRVIGAEVANVSVTQRLANWPHHLTFPGAAAKIDELPLREIVRFPGKRRREWRLRDAVRAMASRAALSQSLPGRDIGGRCGCGGGEKREHCQSARYDPSQFH